MNSQSSGQNVGGLATGLARLAVVLGLGLAVTATACSRSGGPSAGNPARPSAAEAPASVDHGSGSQHRHFTASITTPVAANQSGVELNVTIANCGEATAGCTDGASTQDLGRAEIVVPSGFTVTGVGSFTGDKTWGTTWVSGQTVNVGAAAPQDGQKKLAPGQSVSFKITVTTPEVCDTYALTDPRGSQDTLPAATPDWNFEFYGALSVEVTGCEPVEEDCPAAPSIAAAYLRSLDIKANTPEYQNIVSQVALNMGPGTDFDGYAKCDEGYAQAVRDFIDGILAAL